MTPSAKPSQNSMLRWRNAYDNAPRNWSNPTGNCSVSAIQSPTICARRCGQSTALPTPWPKTTANALMPLGRNYIARLSRASLRMGELIDALLQLASVSRQALKIATTDVSAIARDILDELATTAPERQVQSHVEDDLLIDADPTLIRNALQNLLGNAWKFSRDSQPAIIQVGRAPPWRRPALLCDG